MIDAWVWYAIVFLAGVVAGGWAVYGLFWRKQVRDLEAVKAEIAAMKAARDEYFARHPEA